MCHGFDSPEGKGLRSGEWSKTPEPDCCGEACLVSGTMPAVSMQVPPFALSDVLPLNPGDEARGACLTLPPFHRTDIVHVQAPCPSVCLSVCMCLSVSVSFPVPRSPAFFTFSSVFFCICTYVVYISLSVCLPVCLSVCLPACLPVCLSVCLARSVSVSLYLSLFSVCIDTWMDD